MRRDVHLHCFVPMRREFRSCVFCNASRIVQNAKRVILALAHCWRPGRPDLFESGYSAPGRRLAQGTSLTHSTF